MFDDPLLVSLFLLFILLDNKNLKTVALILALSTFYIFCLWIDGARSVLLSLSLGLLLTAIIKKDISNLKIPSLALLISFSIYQIFHYLLQISSHKLERTDSSGRMEIWLKAIDFWKNNFWFGIGGDHFSITHSHINAMPVSHPHNLFFALTSEWGLAGLFLFFLTIYALFIIIKEHNKMPFFILAACISIFINSCFSNTTYPTTQIPNAIIIALAFFYLNPKVINSPKTHLPVILSIFIIFTYKSDIFFMHPKNPQELFPRFWHNGHSQHLP